MDPTALQSVEDQSEEDKKIAAHVRQKVEESRASASRVAHEGVWMTNIAYLLGYDNIRYDTVTRSFQPANRRSGGKNRLHVNKILPTVQNRLARLCKSPPKYDVRPEGNRQEDKDDARYSLNVLTAMWDKLSLNRKRIPLYMWVQQCGHAWIKVCYDATAGKPMVDPLANKLSFEGDLRAEVVPAFEIFPDPLAKTEDEVLASWLIQCKVRKLDYFKTQYPEKGHLVKEEEAWLLSSQYEQRVNTLNNKSASSNTAEAFKNTALEMVKYEARSEKYPMGRMIVVANGVKLEDKPLPVGEIPFRKFDDVTIGGKLYAEAIITHLRPVQDYYNDLVRKRADWTKKLLAGKYTAARGSALAEESLNDQNSEVVYYDANPALPNGGRPEKLEVPMIPSYAYQEEDRAISMFDEISGMAEVSKGNLPSATIPAIGMQLLVEQNDTRIGVVTEQHEESWAGVGSLILKYVQKFYTMPRKFKFAGKNMEWTVEDIEGSKIKNTDAIVIRGSTLPGSKTVRRQEIMNAWQVGLYGNPQEPKVTEKVLGMMEYGDVGGSWEDFALDMNQIKKGLTVIESEQPIEIHEMDNHTLWIQEMNRYRKGGRYENLSPTAQLIFDKTLEGHVGALMALSGAPPAAPAEAMDDQPTAEELPQIQQGLITEEPVDPAQTGGM